MLDPLAAADFLSVLERLNRETGVTIILTDHRLERTLPLCNQVLLLDAGRLRFLGSPVQSPYALAEAGLEAALPAAARIYFKTGGMGTCPLSVGEGRQYLSRCVHLKENSVETAPAPREEVVLSVRDAWFRYQKKSPDVVRIFPYIQEKFLHCLAPTGAEKPQPCLCWPAFFRHIAEK